MKQDVYEQFAAKALSYLNSTEAFLKEQLPDYFQQILKYEFSWAIISIVVSVIFICLGVAIVKKALPMKEKNYRGDMSLTETGGLLLAVGVVLIGAFSIIGICHTRIATKIYLAPKVFIVDYLRGKE